MLFNVSVVLGLTSNARVVLVYFLLSPKIVTDFGVLLPVVIGAVADISLPNFTVTEDPVAFFRASFNPPKSVIKSSANTICVLNTIATEIAINLIFLLLIISSNSSLHAHLIIQET